MKMFALLAAAVLAAAAVAQERPPAAPADRVRELRRERIATLKEAADVSFRLAQAARVDVREALDDRTALLAAELDGAGTEADRAALRRAAVDALKAYEEVARARADSGRGTQLDVLRVKARRLEIEIQLEHAKAGPPR